MSENKKADSKAIQAFTDLYDSLTDEQKEKAKACKTADELTSLLSQLGVALPDEMLDSVAGGWTSLKGSGQSAASAGSGTRFRWWRWWATQTPGNPRC